jgi:ATP phosphoribosyltransferase regulatory subunit HisZ
VRQHLGVVDEAAGLAAALATSPLVLRVLGRVGVVEAVLVVLVIPGNPRGQLRAMLEERRPVYADLATLTVPTDDLAPEEVAADLAKRLRA